MIRISYNQLQIISHYGSYYDFEMFLKDFSPLQECRVVGEPFTRELKQFRCKYVKFTDSLVNMLLHLMIHLKKPLGFRAILKWYKECTVYEEYPHESIGELFDVYKLLFTIRNIELCNIFHEFYPLQVCVEEFDSFTIRWGLGKIPDTFGMFIANELSKVKTYPDLKEEIQEKVSEYLSMEKRLRFYVWRALSKQT